MILLSDSSNYSCKIGYKLTRNENNQSYFWFNPVMPKDTDRAKFFSYLFGLSLKKPTRGIHVHVMCINARLKQN